MKNKRIIITGGPGFGKTSIISELEARGCHVSHEKARQVIKQQVASGEGCLPWLDIESFSKKVTHEILNESLEESSLIFFDRGIPDVEGYLVNAKANYDSSFYTKAIKKMNYYHKVFFVPPWESIYKNDQQRKETYQQALAISNCLKKAYIDNSFKLIEIKHGSIENRVNFIISELSSPQF